jgi:hypothetical protein
LCPSVRCAEQRLGGEPLPLTVLWGALKGLEEAIAGDGDDDHGDLDFLADLDPLGMGMDVDAGDAAGAGDGAGAGAGASLWRSHPGLAARFVSAVVGIGKIVPPRAPPLPLPPHAGPSAATALHDAAVSLLGRLGPPDLLTVDHGSAPHAPGDALQQSRSDAVVLKVRRALLIPCFQHSCPS